jgi:hypothetical protein
VCVTSIFIFVVIDRFGITSHRVAKEFHFDA